MLIRVWCVCSHSIDEGVRSCINLLSFFFYCAELSRCRMTYCDKSWLWLILWMSFKNLCHTTRRCGTKSYPRKWSVRWHLAVVTWWNGHKNCVLKLIYVPFNNRIILEFVFYCSPVRLLGTYFFQWMHNLLADPFDSRRTYFRQLLFLSFLFFAFIPLQRDTHVNKLRP